MFSCIFYMNIQLNKVYIYCSFVLIQCESGNELATKRNFKTKYASILFY